MNFRKAFLLGLAILGVVLFLSFGTGLTYLIDRSRINVLRDHIETELQQITHVIDSKIKVVQSTLNSKPVNEDVSIALTAPGQYKDFDMIVQRLDKVRSLSDLDFITVKDHADTITAYSVSEKVGNPRTLAKIIMSQCKRSGYLTVFKDAFYCHVTTIKFNDQPLATLIGAVNLNRVLMQSTPRGYEMDISIASPKAPKEKSIICEELNDCTATTTQLNVVKVSLKANYELLSTTWSDISEKFGIILALILVGFVLLVIKTLDFLLFKDLRKVISTTEEVTKQVKVDGTFDHNQALLKVTPKLKEMQTLVSSFSELLTTLSTKEKDLADKSVKAELGALASQVAHDIRSPLSALEVILSSVSDLPENKRTLLRESIHRIRDIANTLLVSYKNINSISRIDSQSSLRKTKIQKTLLFPLIESLVSEKRVEVRHSSQIQIDISQTNASFGLFSEIDSSLLKRILSNLINNSVEALSDVKDGKVEVSLRVDKNSDPLIVIKDNGGGIPSEIIDSLGQSGMTHGKEKGNGLGLHHAKKTILSWNGSLDIESIEGLGTQVKIRLPKSQTPSWFLSKMEVPADAQVMVLDDDQSIHQIWQGRLQSASSMGQNVELIHSQNPDQLREAVKAKDLLNSKSKSLYLIDYEIVGTTETGIDLIEDLGIKDQSVLVTSRYSEPAIQVKCEQMGLKLLPKSMSGFVPMTVGKKS
ncbi:MAG: HAMP domain-containing histidine kinase [Xanthomonadaceae bacterium]|nr:HAMP domain-containing histidine kinase [Xanthomonadaceae bacterium]